MSVSSLVVEKLEAYGVPLQYTSKVAGMFTGDIITLGLRLALISLLASLVKSWFTRLRHTFNIALFPTAYMRGDGAKWIDSYIQQSADVHRQFRHYRLICDKATEYSIAKKDKKGKRVLQSTFVEDGFSGRLLPVTGQILRISVNGKTMWLTRRSEGYGGDPYCSDAHYTLSTWFWNAKQIRAFAVEAYKVHHEKTATVLNIYNHTPHNANWENPISRPSRTWSSLILPGTVKEDLLKDVKDFISEEETAWYTSKGIPHRRGYLLHGPPGTGKTTLATALASTLELDLYCINPGAMGMDNSKLSKCFRNCPPGSMILIEDIDCVMPINRAHQHASEFSGDDVAAADEPSSRGAVGTKTLGPSTVTLSGLLNAIDGVSSQEDSVLVASTNYPDKLDAALRRPGRFDVHVAFDFAVKEQAIDLFKHFYPLSRIQHDSSNEIQEKGQGSAATTSSPFKDQEDLDAAAERFAEHIMSKNIKVSIATIQGFLLLYKKDPVMALNKVSEWAEGIRREQFPNDDEKVNEQKMEKKASEEGEIVVKPKEVKAVEEKAGKYDAGKQKSTAECSEEETVMQEVVLT